MATLLASAQNVLSSCCGGVPGLGKVFGKGDDEDSNAPAAVPSNFKPSKKPATAASSKAEEAAPSEPAEAAPSEPAEAASSEPAEATSEPAAPSNKSNFGFTDQQAKYEDVTYSNLPLSARKAAKAIGFEEKTWDEAEWIAIDDKHWADLTDEEKTACETLGWDAISWDDKYENQAWEDMPEHVQKAAETLGWDQEKWDDDWDVETWDKSWADFTEEEKRCLHVLGYYVQSWD